MKSKKLKSASVILLSLFIVSACQAVSPVSNVNIPAGSSVNESATVIKGKAEFEGFTVKATINDIAPQATIALIYPPDHATNANKTIATGLTDANGNFTVNPTVSFNPALNSIYVLQATKRIGSSGNDSMNITTYIKWKGNSWESMTFPSLFINTRTTALSIIASYNTGTITANDTINKIDVSSGTSVPQNINAQVTAQTVMSVANLVTTVIAGNYDPIQYIYHDGSDYLIKPTDGMVNNWNPASQLIVFQSNRPESTEIMGMYADGTKPANLTNNPAWDYYPSLSPDRSKILFTSNRDGNSEIYVMDSNGTNVVNLTNNAASDFYASWSHDGSKIVFVSNRDGNQEIYTMNANGSGLTRLTNNDYTDTFPRWNNDSTMIVFSTDRDSNYEVYKMTVDGNAPTNISNNPDSFDSFPSWSPNGSKIAFVSDRSGNNEDIFTVNPDGTAVSNITNHAAYDSFPAWSPDSSKIVFTTNRDGNNELYTMNADGSSLARLTNTSSPDANPDWK